MIWGFWSWIDNRFIVFMWVDYFCGNFGSDRLGRDGFCDNCFCCYDGIVFYICYDNGVVVNLIFFINCDEFCVFWLKLDWNINVFCFVDFIVIRNLNFWSD